MKYEKSLLAKVKIENVAFLLKNQQYACSFEK